MSYHARPEPGTKEYDAAVAEARATARATRNRVMGSGFGTEAPVVRSQDRVEAAIHSLRASMGAPVPHQHRHPLAAATAAYGFRDVADLVTELAGGEPRHDLGAYAKLVSPVVAYSPALPTIVTETFRGVAEARRSPVLAGVLAATAQREVASYNEESFSLVDVENRELPDADGMRHYNAILPVVSGETIRLFSRFDRILLSVQSLALDRLDWLGNLLVNYIDGSARVELQGLVDALEGRILMQDGGGLFNAGNTIATTLSLSAYGDAVDALRSQTSEAGDILDAAPAVLLVHSSNEVNALSVLEQLPEAARPRLVSTARFTDANDWYLLADPDAAPVVVRSRLAGAELSGVSFGSFEPASTLDDSGKVKEFPGLAIPATHSVGFSVVSRVGAIKGEAA